jgi:hypothetical protein
MASFLYVAFFLAFSVAFHDQDGHRAIHAFDFDPPGGGLTTQPQDYQGRILFKEGDDQVVTDPKLLRVENLAKSIEEHPRDSALVTLPYENARALRDMMNVVDSFGKNAYFKIEICGHANETELKGKPLGIHDSNKGLGTSRAEWTAHAIEDELRKSKRSDKLTGIDARSCSTGDQYIYEPNKKAVLKNGDPKLMAEVAIFLHPNHLAQKQQELSDRAPKKLTLMDYLYFMVYTITTTGYGDMIPLTPQAKFISIMANLSEILFLVIFFNVVLASIRPLERQLDRVLILKVPPEL